MGGWVGGCVMGDAMGEMDVNGRDLMGGIRVCVCSGMGEDCIVWGMLCALLWWWWWFCMVGLLGDCWGIAGGLLGIDCSVVVGLCMAIVWPWFAISSPMPPLMGGSFLSLRVSVRRIAPSPIRG